MNLKFKGTISEFRDWLDSENTKIIPILDLDTERPDCVDFEIELTEDEQKTADDRWKSDMYDYLHCHE